MYAPIPPPPSTPIGGLFAEPVARLIPASKHEDVATGARTALLSRLEKQPVVQAKRWTRDELYEDER